MESATEAISEFTKETADGRKVPMWETEEVDEIVIAQVKYIKYIFIKVLLKMLSLILL